MRAMQAAAAKPRLGAAEPTPSIGTEIPLPSIDQWERARPGSPLADDRGGDLEGLASPPFELEAGQLYIFSGEVETAGTGLFLIGLREEQQTRWATYRLYPLGGEPAVALDFRPKRTGRYRCVLQILRSAAAGRMGIRRFAPKAYRVRTRPIDTADPTDTCLPSWGPLRRFLHRQCKRSRTINGLVAMAELRLGREIHRAEEPEPGT